MQSPSTKLEAAFLHFGPSIQRGVGVQIKGTMTQRFVRAFSGALVPVPLLLLTVYHHSCLHAPGLRRPFSKIE